jgi:uncharacterized protein YyaL (SSP411 family)
MLYDNAMLAVVYVEAWRQTQNPNYAKVARGVLDFVLREMTGPQGAFYTAFDAEVDAQEGLTYLWTPDEVQSVLVEFTRDDVELFSRVYGLAAGPNFADPHHGTGQPDKNILFLPTPLANVAKSLNVTEEQLDARLEPMRQALYSARRKRKQPLLDTKILTSWNALMIRAFAIAGQALHETRYTDAAVKATHFLLDHHRMADGSLIRTSRPDAKRESEISDLKSQISDSKSQIPGFLDDYAFLTQALLALHRATGDIEWRHRALRVAETMNDKFRDRELGGFFFTAADATDLIVRQKTASDSPLPSGNAVAALALTELGAADIARQVLAVFAQSLEDQAEGMSSMVQAALEYLKTNEPFTVSTDEQATGDHPPTPDQLAKSAVELSADWASPTELRVHVKVLDTFHLNANRAAQGMIPTTLALVGPRGAAIAAHVEYPPGEERQFAFAGEPIRVYEGKVTIAAQLEQPLPPATKLRAALTYQPCTEEACLSATTQAIDVTAP